MNTSFPLKNKNIAGHYLFVVGASFFTKNGFAGTVVAFWANWRASSKF
jgi:hypothetical protein